jgi:hypothetical protein
LTFNRQVEGKTNGKEMENKWKKWKRPNPFFGPKMQVFPILGAQREKGKKRLPAVLKGRSEGLPDAAWLSTLGP